MIGIYKITSPSGKVYIGQSIDIETRMCKYRGLKCQGQSAIYSSLVKYGFDNHVFDVLFTMKDSSFTRDLLNKMEIAYIEFYNCISPNGLNLISGGGSKAPSAETLEKMRLAKLGTVVSEETREKLRILSTGRHHSPESIKKMSEGKKSIGMTDSHKDSIRASNKARTIKVDQYTKSGEYIRTFDSLTEAANHVGCGNESICAVCKGKYGAKSAKGYKWKYSNEINNITI